MRTTRRIKHENDPIKALTCMIENTYRMDENNQLLIVDETEDIVLFTHSADADSGYPITEAVFAGEGEEYMPSDEAMSAEEVMSVEETMPAEVMSVEDAA